MSPLRKELDASLKVMCQDMGFQKHKYDFYKVIGDWSMQIGFVYASYQVKGHILLSCIIGVSNVKLYEIYAKHVGLKYKYPNEIISLQIGYLTPRNSFFEWDVSEYTNLNKLCEEIKLTILKYGYPFFEKYANMDYLYDSLLYRRIYPIGGNRGIWLSIIDYFKGNNGDAIHHLAEGFMYLENGPYHSELEEQFHKNFMQTLHNIQLNEN